MFHSIRRKLTKDFALMMIGALIVFDLLSYAFLWTMLRQNEQSTLAVTLADQINEWQPGGEPMSQDGLWWITDSQGRIITASPAAGHVIGLEWKGLGHPLEQGEFASVDMESPSGREGHWLFAGDQLGNSDQRMLVALNITEAHRAIRVWGVISVLLSTVFTVIFAWLAGRMSNRAMQPISEALDKQKRFTADASHELRTPLAVMQSSIDVLEAEGTEQLSPYTREVLHDMRDEVTGMSRLVSELLQLARWDAGLQLELEPLDAASLIQQAYRRFAPLAAERQLTLQADIAAIPLPLQGDSHKLQQLLGILLDNAITYTPTGGRIMISGYRDHEYDQIVITCLDNGPGIPEENVEKIFERFYRVESSRSRSPLPSSESYQYAATSGGFGLGLAIAAEITNAHGGEILASNPLDGGTLFTVQLPSLPEQELK